MGVGGEKKGLPEIDSTRAASRDAAFEAIVEKIKSRGGEIESDDTHPLYTDVGMDEFEIGEERTIVFNLRKMDFKLIRKVETHILQGAGKQKHIEELETPRSRITLFLKPELGGDWQAFDPDDMSGLL